MKKHDFEVILKFKSELRIDPDNPPDIQDRINSLIETGLNTRLDSSMVRDLTLWRHKD